MPTYLSRNRKENIQVLKTQKINRPKYIVDRLAESHEIRNEEPQLGDIQ